MVSTRMILEREAELAKLAGLWMRRHRPAAVWFWFVVRQE
jgi:hypothetical protein